MGLVVPLGRVVVVGAGLLSWGCKGRGLDGDVAAWGRPNRWSFGQGFEPKSERDLSQEANPCPFFQSRFDILQSVF